MTKVVRVAKMACKIRVAGGRVTWVHGKGDLVWSGCGDGDDG